MKGVEYFFDRNGEPKAVLIDLKRHGQLWDDFQDIMVANQRRHEPTIPLEEVKAVLRKKGSHPNPNELMVLRVVEELGGECAITDLFRHINGTSDRDRSLQHAVFPCRTRHEPPLLQSVWEGPKTYLHERLAITSAGKA